MVESQNRVCPLCGESKGKPYLQKGELHLMQCLHCSMIYVNPVPAEMVTGTFYDQAGDEYLAADKLESDYSDVRFERELCLFQAYCPRGSILDVGCSSGAFLHQLKKLHPNDYQILGTDVSKAPLNHAVKMGVPVIQGSFLTHSFEQTFDAVTFWAVMEHLFEPQLFLKKAESILKPGGFCFILVPNMNSLAVKLLGSKYRYILAEHLNYFAPHTLKKFAGTQFSVADMTSMHFNPLVIWHDFHGRGLEVSRPERAKLLKQTIAYKQNPLLKPVKLVLTGVEAMLGKWNLCDNLAMVLQKPQ